MLVREIMSARVVCVELDDRLSVVKEIFDRLKFHHLLVVESGQLQGVISDRDLLRALSPFIGTLSETTRDANTLEKRVHQIMTRRPITVTSDAAVADAIGLFLNRQISCLPVVDAKNHPVGIVSWRDVLRSIGGATAST